MNGTVLIRLKNLTDITCQRSYCICILRRCRKINTLVILHTGASLHYFLRLINLAVILDDTVSVDGNLQRTRLTSRLTKSLQCMEHHIRTNRRILKIFQRLTAFHGQCLILLQCFLYRTIHLRGTGHMDITVRQSDRILIIITDTIIKHNQIVTHYTGNIRITADPLTLFIRVAITL